MVVGRFLDQKRKIVININIHAKIHSRTTQENTIVYFNSAVDAYHTERDTLLSNT